MQLAGKAWETVCEYVQDRGLRRHMRAVGVAMDAYARQLNADPDRWRAIGYIHDFDWEIHPDLDRHPIAGAPILRARGWDDELIRTVLSHYEDGTGVARSAPVDYALLACDEITGLIIAATLVRPNRNIADVELKSVQKKWKTRGFAAGVDRAHVEQATADFSAACFDGRLDLWTHVGNVLAAMQASAAELGLDGSDA